ncbi:hypothetical protein [Nocardia sp. NPDC050793]|uniref:hypothetical protein n=1 Tax=Nocardia sp. NPDC050793 TaxID=3155159 RepID=UPI0033EF5D61
MRAPSVDTGTALRLARIAALVVGCLLFLHACERTRRVIPADVWIELAFAAALGVGAMVVAWFEIARAEELDEEEDLEPAADEDRPVEALDECRIESEERTVRIRIAKSGNLVLHGQDHGPHPGHEWSWTFRPETFPAIRAALGGDRESDLIELLEDVVLDAGPEIRDDPGAWLRAHGIAAAYREKGDHPSRVTTKLPIFRVGMRRLPEADRAAALPRGRGTRAADEAPPERSSRPKTPRETVAARDAGSTVASRRAASASASRPSAQITEARRSAQVTESRRAAPEPESADDRPALPRRSRTTDAPQRAATRRTRSAHESPRSAEEPASEQRARERAARRTRPLDAPPSVPVDPIAPRRNGRPSAADLPSRDRGAAAQRRHTAAASTPAAAPEAAPPQRKAAATAAYGAASDLGVPPQRRPAAAAAYEAALEDRRAAEPPDRGYPPPISGRRRAHRYL